MNEAAAALLQMAGDRAGAASTELSDRRDTCLELLRTGSQPCWKNAVSDGQTKQVFLTSHRPVRIAERNLLLSSSADITEQKALEDNLFRSAYYDELTGLPTRRVIEHRVNSLLKRDSAHGHFALAFLDVDNFKHINDYYGHPIGDALLVEVAKRLGLDLRESDMLSRISGDEFLLLLNPIQSEQEVAEYIHFIAGAAEGAVLHRRIGDLRFDLDRRQPLSRARPQLRRCCARTPISRCTASRTAARAPRPSSTPAWSARRWRG